MDLQFDTEILKLLLQDHATGKNILWATDDYENISAEEEIQIERLSFIQPRYKKIHEQKKLRTRQKAEIFTPSWICNEQNNLIDEAWFGRSGIFNKIVDEKKHLWQSTPDKIIFAEGRSWQDYILVNRLEITCGEAPYLVSRYDAVTGEEISVKNRIGLLDRKLRIVSENTFTESEWRDWAEKSVQSIYGYEFQGDNLFIARKNILQSVQEFFEDKFKFSSPIDFLKDIAEIISWNLWQMDGLKGIVPYSDKQKKVENIKLNFYAENNFEVENQFETEDKSKIFCKIKDWKTGEEKIFANLGVNENGKI